MPVTAKLSREFYDRFGEDVAGELVDWFNQLDSAARSDLRELNELNFARFDAKLEQRSAELRSDVDRKFAEFQAQIDRRFAELKAQMDTRFAEFQAQIDTRFAELQAKFDTRFAEFQAQIDRRFAELQSQFRVELRTAISASHDSTVRWMIGLWVTQMLAFALLWMQR